MASAVMALTALCTRAWSSCADAPSMAALDTAFSTIDCISPADT
jgi:hypothetical protein